MEIQYGIEQPLRLYENRLHQNQNREGVYKRDFNLYCPVKYLLPFQIKRVAGIKSITSIKVVNNKTNVATDILSSLATGEIEKLAFQNFDYLIHYGQAEHTATISAGEYYLKITDDTTTWYSEVITFVDFDKDDIRNSCIKTKIEYWDKYNVGDIFYRTYQFASSKQYKNIVYLDIPTGRPEWDAEIEGDEDGEGQLVPETLTREKEYLLQGVFPEYMLDALTMLPLHLSVNSQIYITTEYGYTAKINKIDIGKPEWIGGDGGSGRLAKMDFNFITVTQVKTNCASALIPLTTCVRTDFSYETLLLEGSTHYNNGTFADGLTTKSITHGATVMIEYSSGLVNIKTFDSTNNGTPESMYKSAFVTHTKGDVYVNKNLPIGQSEPYLFYGGHSVIGFLTAPILSYVGATSGGVASLPYVKGSVITNSLVELWDVSGEPFHVADLKPELVNGAGAVVGGISSDKTYQLKTIGLNCDLGVSNEKTY